MIRPHWDSRLYNWTVKPAGWTVNYQMPVYPVWEKWFHYLLLCSQNKVMLSNGGTKYYHAFDYVLWNWLFQAFDWGLCMANCTDQHHNWSIFKYDITKKCMLLQLWSSEMTTSCSLQVDRQQGCCAQRGTTCHSATLCWPSYFIRTSTSISKATK